MLKRAIALTGILSISFVLSGCVIYPVYPTGAYYGYGSGSPVVIAEPSIVVAPPIRRNVYVYPRSYRKPIYYDHYRKPHYRPHRPEPSQHRPYRPGSPRYSQESWHYDRRR